MEQNPISVTFDEAYEMLSRDDSVLLFDVRSEAEYIVGHAEGAALFPLPSINEETAAQTIPSKSTPVVLYCKSGKRAAQACGKLCAYGYERVYNLGSLIGWPYGIEQGD